ncbi:uncharacterized protein VTP21DRAFT_5034 [Calcarisporiella thermophila]|uniref:uncharacterized protein n=1 Tax=Calcarisporiella thermophila TaxID=911321 RepID=UPI0037424416
MRLLSFSLAFSFLILILAPSTNPASSSSHRDLIARATCDLCECSNRKLSCWSECCTSWEENGWESEDPLSPFQRWGSRHPYDLSTVPEGIPTTNPLHATFSALFLLIGLLLLFAAYRIHHLALFFVGLFTFALIAFIALANSEPPQCYPNRFAVYLGVCLAFAVVGAAVCVFVVIVGILLIPGEYMRLFSATREPWADP